MIDLFLSSMPHYHVSKQQLKFNVFLPLKYGNGYVNFQVRAIYATIKGIIE